MTDEPVRNVYDDEVPVQEGTPVQEEPIDSDEDVVLTPGQKDSLLDKVEAAFEIGKILRDYKMDLVVEDGEVKLVKLA